MQFLYARTSTKEQNIDQQIKYLKSRYHFDDVYTDKVTGANLNRPEFLKLRARVQAGDSIIVQDLSRIGRNTTEVLDFVEEMKSKSVGIQIDDLGKIDITTSAGKLVLTTLAAVATMQREQMLEKQAIGIAQAKSQGKFKGKQQTQATIEKCKQALDLITNNSLSKQQAARAVGIGVATLYRFIKKNKRE